MSKARLLKTLTIKILNGQTTSDSWNMSEYELVGLITPAALTGIPPSLFFQASMDNVTFYDAQDGGGGIARIPGTLAVDTFYALNANYAASFTATTSFVSRAASFMRFYMGGGGQAADRLFTVVLRRT